MGVGGATKRSPNRAESRPGSGVPLPSRLSLRRSGGSGAAAADSKAPVDGRRSAVRRSEKVAATPLSCRHLYPRGMMGNP